MKRMESWRISSLRVGWIAVGPKISSWNLIVNNNTDGLIASVNDGSASAFLWEW